MALVQPSILNAGVFNDVDKPWETFAGRENGAPRSRGEPADLWDSNGSPTDDPYRGLTPPISPAQVRKAADWEDRRDSIFAENMFVHEPYNPET